MPKVNAAAIAPTHIGMVTMEKVTDASPISAFIVSE